MSLTRTTYKGITSSPNFFMYCVVVLQKFKLPEDSVSNIYIQHSFLICPIHKTELNGRKFNKVRSLTGLELKISCFLYHVKTCETVVVFQKL